MRVDESLGFKITKKVGTTSHFKSPAEYIADLDFADDRMVVLDYAINSQKQLDSADYGSQSRLEDEQQSL
jgi:hypothetical protein